MTILLVTGGAGFIGSNFVYYMLKHYPNCQIRVLDKLTYAGNLNNLRPLWDDPRFQFTKGDICDQDKVRQVASGVDAIINFAAETHVDRSIVAAEAFIKTDILGTFVLLEAVKDLGINRYVQISTDEVYGSITDGSFKETDPLNPSSPYAASKAGADLLVLSYWVTHKLPVLITRSSNNYGPYQYPEKIVPLFITNAMEDKPLPVYGDGLNVRDWLYVEDNCAAIALILHKGQPGEIYNVGADQEYPNIDITKKILQLLDKPESLIKFVPDRKGHDRRYSLDSAKLKTLGWEANTSFSQGLKKTVNWYLENRRWWQKIKSGKFKQYYKKQYQLE